jgi:hypothetical protein
MANKALLAQQEEYSSGEWETEVGWPLVFPKMSFSSSRHRPQEGETEYESDTGPMSPLKPGQRALGMPEVDVLTGAGAGPAQFVIPQKVAAPVPPAVARRGARKPALALYCFFAHTCLRASVVFGLFGGGV